MCSTCECCFHPYAFELAEKNLEFKKMLCNTALDAIDKQLAQQQHITSRDYKIL